MSGEGLLWMNGGNGGWGERRDCFGAGSLLDTQINHCEPGTTQARGQGAASQTNACTHARTH